MKYIKTSKIKQHAGIIVYRIQALKNFNNVKKGDIGGYVEGYRNLSQFNDI